MLKGIYAAGTTYDVGDIVEYTDGAVYLMHQAAPSGTPPTNTRYWTKQTGFTAVAALLALDAVALVEAKYGDPITLANNLTTTATKKALDARQGKAIKELIDALDERVTALEPAPETEENTESDAT